jgi:4-hydroxybenzoate polyprenyltransferase
MYLNDAFDEDFDRQRRPERPIPSGQISARNVWCLGWAWLALGIVLLIILGRTTGALALLLALLIVIYNATHKLITASPWLMGACRFWVYVIAGATGTGGMNGWPIFCGAALAFYVAGLSYVARRESFRGTISYWPLLLLAAPVILAMTMNVGDFRLRAIWISMFLVLWTARCVRPIFSGGEINAGWIVTNLLAGIVFVDWLAIAPDCSRWMSFVLLALFGLTKLLQKSVPAT